MSIEPISNVMPYQATPQVTPVATQAQTQEDAAARVGKSRSAVANYLRLLKLPKPIQKMVTEGSLSEGHARALLGFTDEEQMFITADLAAEKGLTVREIEKRARAQSSKKARNRRNPEARADIFTLAELHITQTTGRKFKVHENKKGAGTFEMEFFSEEDFRELMSKLGED